VSVSGKENGGATHRASGTATRRWKWASAAAFLIGRGTPMTLGGGDDLLQHRSRRGKVRRGPSVEEKVAQRELTEGGGWRRRFAQFRRDGGSLIVGGGHEVKGGGRGTRCEL
jgi:hypothetical protein